MPAPTPTTRLAPSPTGALHLGNARTFLVTWALARRRGWRIVLRIEDIDGPRVKPGAIDDCVRTLEWLGLDWDDGPIVQSADLAPHALAMRSLGARALAYPCELTRAEIDGAASAPHDPPHADARSPADPEPLGAENRFPPSLRPLGFDTPHDFDPVATNWRLITRPSPAGAVEFTDEFAGPQRRCPFDTIGDFVLWTKRAQPSYQLAVVVDDHRQGVTHVVRADDLLDSAARQLLLYRALGYWPEPAYCHLPLVVGPDGRRLAKRHGDTRLSYYAEKGVTPERVVALLGRWCGMGVHERLSASDFAASIDLSTIPRSPVTFTPEDDAWLLER